MSSLYPPSYMSVVSPHLEDGSIPVLLMEPLPRLFPFLPPLPPHRPLRVYDCPLEPAFIQRRNERERQRVETLRAAIKYIQQLQGLVQRGGGALPVGPGTNN
ncbi:Achaete-scute like 5 [Dissostichus eleginoides]|uniref:Achaete-scute like 5 n=1 Tax=Dissostichus eleginoides TaxID=100907 RepID=A0AAD9CGX4_DISEL|nr:Achaete-scute like 5 [Dissostichus eleginoides]